MSPPFIKGLVFCADDYGLAPGLGDAIRKLAEMQRLSAVSCMVTSPYWVAEGAKLKVMRPQPDVGLHLTLTDQPSLGNHPALTRNGQFRPMSKLFKKTVSGKLPEQAVRQEIKLQIEAFRDVMGRYPDFIDGHQHVHQFPIVGDQLIQIMKSHPALQKAWVRVCWDSPWRILRRRAGFAKALVIGLSGIAFHRRAQTHSIRMNRGFAGFYDFSRTFYDDALMRQMIGPSVNGTVVMCHPGLVDKALVSADSLTTPREQEYNYLQSDQFSMVLMNSSCKICLPKDLF